MEGLLTTEQIKSAKILRAIYENSKKESLQEEMRIWDYKILPVAEECGFDVEVIKYDQHTFDKLVEVSEKNYNN